MSKYNVKIGEVLHKKAEYSTIQALSFPQSISEFFSEVSYKVLIRLKPYLKYKVKIYLRVVL